MNGLVLRRMVSITLVIIKSLVFIIFFLVILECVVNVLTKSDIPVKDIVAIIYLVVTSTIILHYKFSILLDWNIDSVVYAGILIGCVVSFLYTCIHIWRFGNVE